MPRGAGVEDVFPGSGVPAGAECMGSDDAGRNSGRPSPHVSQAPLVPHENVTQSRSPVHPPTLIMKLMPKTRELEVRLERTEQQLRLFQKISRFMVRDMSLQEVLQGIVSLIVEFMECDSCWCIC